MTSATFPAALPRPRFTLEDAQRAHDAWRFNCGPFALAIMLGLTPDELRPHLGDFEAKGYTNPKLMYQVLYDLLGVVSPDRMKGFNQPCQADGEVMFADYGLSRVQWHGPWMKPGVPIAARYRKTHWVGSMIVDGQTWIADVNAMCVGGWVPLATWRDQLVPWLLQQCVPGADGAWSLTHRIELETKMKGPFPSRSKA